MLSQFPPPTVRLKLPFSIKPWTGSEDNVGKLLMVMLYSSYILALFFLLFGHFLRDVEILNISWLVLLAKILRLPWFINGHTIFMGTSFLRNINCEGRCHLPCSKASKASTSRGVCWVFVGGDLLTPPLFSCTFCTVPFSFLMKWHTVPLRRSRIKKFLRNIKLQLNCYVSFIYKDALLMSVYLPLRFSLVHMYKCFNTLASILCLST